MENSDVDIYKIKISPHINEIIKKLEHLKTVENIVKCDGINSLRYLCSNNTFRLTTSTLSTYFKKTRRNYNRSLAIITPELNSINKGLSYNQREEILKRMDKIYHNLLKAFKPYNIQAPSQQNKKIKLLIDETEYQQAYSTFLTKLVEQTFKNEILKIFKLQADFNNPKYFENYIGKMRVDACNKQLMKLKLIKENHDGSYQWIKGKNNLGVTKTTGIGYLVVFSEIVNLNLIEEKRGFSNTTVRAEAFLKYYKLYDPNKTCHNQARLFQNAKYKIDKLGSYREYQSVFGFIDKKFNSIGR